MKRSFWLVFCLLTVVSQTVVLYGEQVVFSELMYHPTGTQPEYIEVFNNTATPLDMADWKLRGGVDYDFPSFSSANPGLTFLKPFERVLLGGVEAAALRDAYGVSPAIGILGPWTGSLNNAGEKITLKDKNGVVVCAVTFNDRGKWSPAADGAGHSLVLIDPNKSVDNWRNWSVSQRPGGTPGGVEILEAETPVSSPEVNLSQGIPFVNYGDVWKFHDQNLDLGTAWRNPGYNDSSWPQGPGLLGFESSALPAPGIQTPLFNDTDANNLITYYFRKTFTYNGSLQNVNLSIDQIVDDSAAYYLNGQELGRYKLPGGTINWKTTAEGGAVGNATELLNVISASGSALVNGVNVLAAELHQVNNSSSDAVFGCRLNISVPSQDDLVINEVLPGGPGVGFVEFYNPTGGGINLRNYYLSDDPGNLQQQRIMTDLVVPAGGFASVGFSETGLSSGSALTVFLTDPDGVTALNAISTSVALTGRSIGRKPAGSSSWFLFADSTRDAPNTSQADLAAVLRLSEVHFSESNTVDWVEFYNAGGDSLSLTGFYLASESDLSNKLALNQSIPAKGYASVDGNFPVLDGEVPLFLVSGANTVLAARLFQKSSLGDSLQAFPAGADEWFGAAISSRDAANNPARYEDVVINEIMYDPPSDEVAGEFVELHNRGNVPIEVSHWRFTDGLSFSIPPGTIIPANGYLVIAADETWMRLNYGNIAVVGNFAGRLSNNGDLIRLVDQWGNLVDEVDYLPGGSWPNFANGHGSSMELLNPWMDNHLPSAWSDSNETNKTSFQHYSYADVFRQLRADGAATDSKELHLHSVGDSHLVLRDIQLRQNGAGANLLQNSDRMSADCCSASGWLAQGTHHASHLQGNELHLLADGHGDNRPNRVEIDATAMNSGQTYEVSFDARWVIGSSRLVVQTWDHSIATSFSLPIPNNLGTPGESNSKYALSPAAQVDDLLHSPPVPASGETVRVTAKITSATPGPQLRLYHRLDNLNGDGAWNSKPMFDDGFSGGDALAGDGIYTAELTEYGSGGNVAQFYVRAIASGQFTQMPKWGEDRPAMYVVDTPSSVGDLRRMRFVVSALDRDALNDQDNPTGVYGYKFPRLSNHYFNTTIIINEREVIYNGEIRNSGSPWTRGNSLDRGKYKLPKDKLFRGKEKFQFDNDAGGGSRHHNRLVRYWLYLLGHPVNENEYIQVEVNTGGSALKEEVEPLGNDLLNRNYANGSQGELYRIDDEWWFQDNWSRNSRNADWSYKGTDNSGRYRTEWMKRSREDEDDFSALIGFFQKINQGYTQSEIERLIDPMNTLKMAAVRGYIHDWDSFSLNRGKNGYFYRRSTDGLFMFWHWDSDLAFRSGDLGAAFYNGMTGFRPYIEKPYNMRLFKHYLALVVEAYSRNSPRMDAWIQAEEDASSQYSVSAAYQATWFPGRETPALNFLGNSRNTTFNITSNNGQPISTSAATANLAGLAPLRVFRVEVLGHPEAEFAWTSDTAWTLSGIQLNAGINTLTLNGVDEFGGIQHTDTITVNKSGNAVPVMVLKADPKSWHLSVIDELKLDARDSFDPDGSPLTFGWSAGPSDAQLDDTGMDQASALFPRPGLYTFTVTGTDANGGSSSIQREAAVYAPNGFSSFSEPVLNPYWNTENVARRQNYDGGPYFSNSEVDGHLLIQMPDDRARPLGHPLPNYPCLWRALPGSSDWTFMTQVKLIGQVFGEYMTGLMVEISETSGTVRYAFGIEDGNLLTAKRVTATGTATRLKSAPLTANEATVRIRRYGNILVFEIQHDGVWTLVHSTGLTTGAAALQGGLFLATDTAQLIRAAFDYALLVDPSASSDLRENLRISEIMYNPIGSVAYDSGEFEYIELVNIGETPLDLTGVYFSDGITYAFGNTQLGAKQYLVVVKNRDAFASRYGLGGLNIADGSFAPSGLRDSGETIELSDAEHNLILSVTYSDTSPWPEDPDGTGRSLEVIDLTGNANDPANWQASAESNGSPGRGGGQSLGTVIVNEVLTHTDYPLEDAIELHNRTDHSLDISGWFLSDSREEVKKFRIPDGTVLTPGGYAVFYEVEFNTNNSLSPFSLSSAKGDQVYLSAADAQGNLTGYQNWIEFDPAENGISMGRYATSVGADFTAMQARTLGRDNPPTVIEFRTGAGEKNSAPRVGPVVINEIMYHPLDMGGTNDNAFEEFIELHNVTTNTVRLYDPAFPTNEWRLRGGVDFDFPPGHSLLSRGYLLLVGFDPDTNATETASFRGTYGLPASVPIYGPYSGKLRNSSEWVKLLKPDTPQGPGPDAGVAPYVPVDQVRYADVVPWPVRPDGLGDSLQRRRPSEYGNDPVNWKSSAATAGRANVDGSTTIDGDGDGLPDDFETANGLNPSDPTDAAADQDQDGASNEAEYLAGTGIDNALDFPQPPVIETQPASREIPLGSAATFQVVANGSTPLSYQWRVNGMSIASGIQSSLVITNVQISDSAQYEVVVRNADGFVISESVLLTVNQPLRITSQPLSQYADVGSTVTLTVLAYGTGPLTYQWLFDGVEIPSATEASLILPDAQGSNSGNYSVMVTDDVTSLTSASATLTVLSPPTIVRQPESQIGVAYNDIYFFVQAGGQGPFFYQWRFNGVNIASGATAILYLPNVQPGQAGIYTVEVSNPVSGVVSSPAELTLLIPATITQQPQDVIGAEPGSTVTFTVVANSSTPMTYQWRFNDVEIPGATQSSLTLNNIQEVENGLYHVVITDGVGPVASEVVILTVRSVPVIIQNLVSLSVVEGGNATFSIETKGALPIGYRWRFNYTQQTTNYEVYAHKTFFTVYNVTTNDNDKWAQVILTNYFSAPPGIGPRAKLYVLPDADHDGMPTEWETRYELNPHDPSDADLDHDLDWMTNLQEYQAGTNPTNNTSYLWVSGLAAGDGALVTFPASSNCTYTIEYTDSLNSGLWLKLDDIVARPTNHVQTVPDLEWQPQRFYRIATPRQPDPD